MKQSMRGVLCLLFGMACLSVCLSAGCGQPARAPGKSPASPAATGAWRSPTPQAQSPEAAVSPPVAEASQSPSPALPPSPSLTPSQGSPAPQSAAGSPAPSASAPAAFTDTKGCRGESEIGQLARLGVFDEVKGSFQPDKTVTRAEFVRWLVRAGQAIWFDNPGRCIALATGSTPTFTDVPAGHPDFRAIQGMADAKYLTYFGQKTFRPSDAITREEMVDLKAMVDQLGRVARDAVPGQVARDWGFIDADSISSKYLPAILDDHDQWLTSRNIERIWGRPKSFLPKKPVTREEAALCLAAQGARGSSFRTAAEALAMKSGR